MFLRQMGYSARGAQLGGSRTALSDAGESCAGVQGEGLGAVFVRKMGVSFFIMTLPGAALAFDEGARLVSRLRSADLAEQLNGRLSEGN